MKKTTLALIATAALLTACNKNDSPAANTSPGGGNTGLEVGATMLTQSDLSSIASLDQKERLALPSITDRSDRQIPQLAPLVDGFGDLAGAFSTLDRDCATGTMNEEAATFLATFNCEGVKGRAFVSAPKLEIDLQLIGTESRASINHVFTSVLENGDLTITRAADDHFMLVKNDFVIKGTTSLVFRQFAANQVLNVEINGTLAVSKNAGADDVITVSSSNVKYIATSPSRNSRFCGGSVTYSSQSGLQKSINLDACPQ